jgi:hypothetical protein
MNQMETISRSEYEICPDVDCIEQICEYFNTVFRHKQLKNSRPIIHITLDKLRLSNRSEEYVVTRMFVYWYLRHYCHWRVGLIGYFFRKDHTTIVHALECLKGLLRLDSTFQQYMTDLAECFVTPHYLADADLFLGQFKQSKAEYLAIQSAKAEPIKELKKRLKKKERQLNRLIADVQELKKAIA